MGCRLPGGICSAEELWQALLEGRDLISTVPADRFSTERFVHPVREARGHSVTFSAGITGDVRLFDAGFFKMGKLEAQTLDPQQRLVLEMSLEAFESAGIKPSAVKGSNTAVFIGAASTDMAMTRADDAAAAGPYTMTGTNLSIISNRLSYFYDLHGESMTIDTACSSAMTALCKACEALLAGGCSMALAGGVNILLSPLPFVGFSQAHMLSATGRCRVFSADADGYVRSEGGAVLLLKRLDEALEAGDPIIGVIRAAALNQDGSTNGIAMPNGKAQKALLQHIYDHRDLGHLVYVEAHGTGTAAGDPIECDAIGTVLGKRLQQEKGRKLYIGSVKSNAGHLETASGMAGLIKSLMILKHRELPAQIWADRLNPRIDFADLNLQVVQEPVDLSAISGPLQIGINSFGFGGSNAHVLLESAPLQTNTKPQPQTAAAAVKESKESAVKEKEDDRSAELLLLSAKSPAALAKTASSFASWLEEHPDIPVNKVAASLMACRELYGERLLIAASDRSALLQALHSAAGDAEKPEAQQAQLIQSQAAPTGKLALVCSGNGSQYAGMGADLYKTLPEFAAAFDEAAAQLHALSGTDYQAMLLQPEPTFDLDAPLNAQPLIFAIEYALGRLLLSRGFRPDGCTGHSVGEIAAAALSGALSLRNACLVVLKRSYWQGKTSTTGGMAAVRLPTAKLQALLRLPEYAGVTVAASNAPDSFTLSGSKDDLHAIGRQIKALHGAFRLLKLDYAFHSAFMDPIAEPLLQSLTGVCGQKGILDFYSAGKAAKVAGSELDGSYWWHNVRDAVRFADTIKKMQADGYTQFIEIGPRPILLTYLKQITSGADHPAAVDSLYSRTKHEGAQTKESLWRLLAAGFKADWGVYFDPALSDRSLALPHYAFDRKIFWPEESHNSFKYFNPEKISSILGCKLPYVSSFINELDAKKQTFLAGHVVQEQVLLPFAAYLCAGTMAARAFARNKMPMRLVNLQLYSPVNLSDGPRDFLVQLQNDRELTFNVRSQGTADFTQTAVCRALPAEEAAVRCDLPAVKSSMQSLPPESLYRRAAELGIDYQLEFRRLKELYAAPGKALALLDMHSEQGAGEISIAGLDGALQLLFAAGGAAGFKLQQLYLPSQAGEFYFAAAAGQDVWALLEITKASHGSIVCDISFYLPDGRRCGVLQGCRYLAVPQDAAQLPCIYEQKLLPRPELYTVSPAVEQAAAVLTALSKSYPLADEDSADGLFAAALCALALKHVQAESGPDPLPAELIFGRLIDDRAAPLALLLCRSMCLFDFAREEEDEAFVLTGGDREPLDFGSLTAALLAEYPQAAVLSELLWLLDLKLESFLEDGLSEVFRPQLTYLSERIVKADLADLRRQALLEQALKALAGSAPLRIVEVSYSAEVVLPAALKQGGAECWQLILQDDSRMEALRQADAAEQNHILAPAAFAACFNEGKLPAVMAGQADLILLSAKAAAFLAAEHSAAAGSAGDVLGAALSACLKEGGLLAAVSGGQHSMAHSLCSCMAAAAQPGAEEILNRLSGLFASAGLQAEAVAAPDEQCVISQLWRKPAVADAGSSAVPKAAAGTLLWVAAGAEALPQELLEQSGSCALSAATFLSAPSRTELTALMQEKMGEAAHHSGELKLCLWLQPDEILSANANAAALATLLNTLRLQLQQAADLKLPLTLAVDGRGEKAFIAQAALALLRTARHELNLPQCRAVVLRDGDDAALLQRLTAECRLQTDCYEEIWLEPNQRLSTQVQLQKSGLGAESGAEADSLDKQTDDGLPHTNRRLIFDKPGRLSSLHMQPEPLRALQDDEILVEVKATALNFRDVMWAAGLLPDEALENGFAGESLGLECSGVIKAVGRQITDLRPGQEVMAFAPASFSDYIITKREAVLPKPDNLSFAGGAALPVVFFTAYYALKYKAQATAGESILIHGGAGGVGLAALQLARMMGLKVYATAGSDLKRQLLRSLGADYVYNSRSFAFADEIRRDTGGAGVDIVLNSLYADGAALSLELLAPLGRFVELGKRDFYADHALHLRHFKDNLSYFAVDADALLNLRPAFCARLMGELIELFSSGQLQSIPLNLYREGDIPRAFAELRSSAGIGKLIVLKDSTLLSSGGLYDAYTQNLQQLLAEHTDTAADAVPVPVESSHPAGFIPGSLQLQGTVVISGGLGGIGSALACHLAECGVERVLVLGRSSAERAAEKLSALREKLEAFSCRLDYAAVDIADGAAVQAVLAQADLGHVCVLCHAAGFLNDKLLQEVTAEDFADQLQVKMCGLRNISSYFSSRENPDCVLYFSSVAALMGNPGQITYAAANAALEGSVAALSCRLPQSKVICAGWGPVAEVGMLSGREQVLTALKRRLGTAALSIEEVLTAVDYLFSCSSGVYHCFKANWQSISADVASDSRFAEISARFNVRRTEGAQDLLTRLSSLDGPALEEALFNIICSEVAALMGSSSDEVKAQTSLQSLGLDSLSLMELTAHLSEMLQLKLTPEVFASCTTLQGFARSLAALMRGSSDAELMLSTMEEQHGLARAEESAEG